MPSIFDPDLTAAEAVAAGVAVLNDHRPGWRHDVNADTLNLRSSLDCVLGQVYGDYWKGCSHLAPVFSVDRLEERIAWSRTHGFSCDIRDGLFSVRLHAEWQRVLRRTDGWYGVRVEDGEDG